MSVIPLELWLNVMVNCFRGHILPSSSKGLATETVQVGGMESWLENGPYVTGIAGTKVPGGSDGTVDCRLACRAKDVKVD